MVFPFLFKWSIAFHDLYTQILYCKFYKMLFYIYGLVANMLAIWFLVTLPFLNPVEYLQCLTSYIKAIFKIYIAGSCYYNWSIWGGAGGRDPLYKLKFTKLVIFHFDTPNSLKTTQNKQLTHAKASDKLKNALPSL